MEKIELKNYELASINPNRRDWKWVDFFNFWAVSIQSIISFSLITSLYLLYDINSLIVLCGTVFAGLIVLFLSNTIGKISQNSGLPFPVILRISFGLDGARYIAMSRGLIGIFMFGIQTFFISKSIGYIFRIILYKIDTQLINNEFFLQFYFGLNAIDLSAIILTLIFQFLLFTHGPNFNKSFIRFSSIFVYLGLVVFLIIIISENFNELVSSLKLSTNIENIISKNNISPFVTITGTMFAYFSILIVNFGDFSRYAKNYNELKKGNLSLLLNIIIFSFLSLLICLGSDIILAKNLITVDSLLTNPNDIIGKINNNFLTVISLIFIIISSLSTNLIANYIPSQNTLINLFPGIFSVKSTGTVIAIFALIISIFWISLLNNQLVLSSFDTLTALLGPIFGIVIADYYHVQEKKINHKELFYPNENTSYIYNNGWNYKAIYSLILGFIFSASTIWNINLIQFQSFGWIIGAFVSYIIYYSLNQKQK